MQISENRIVYLDVLRVLATFMVVTVHVGDAYVFNGETMTFGKESSFFAVLFRSSVPLFIIMSSILLLPLKTGGKAFFKRRFTRVAIPFLVWSIIYVFLPVPSELTFGGPENVFTDSGMNTYVYNLMMIPINFTGSNVHFWFIYIILGIYLFMPILSPWLKTATKQSLIFFLSIWAITLFFPYIKLYFPQIHGQCDWNSFGMLYYFGGYLGYVILGYFLHHYNRLSAKSSVAIGGLFFIVGVAVTYIGYISDQQAFLNKIAVASVEDWKLIEFNINFMSPNVVLMTVGVFMMFQKMKASGWVQRVFKELSVLSYGIFLVHYIITLWAGDLINGTTPLNPGVEQFMIALLTFMVSYGIIKLISFVPKAKYLIG